MLFPIKMILQKKMGSTPQKEVSPNRQITPSKQTPNKSLSPNQLGDSNERLKFSSKRFPSSFFKMDNQTASVKIISKSSSKQKQSITNFFDSPKQNVRPVLSPLSEKHLNSPTMRRKGVKFLSDNTEGKTLFLSDLSNN